MIGQQPDAEALYTELLGYVETAWCGLNPGSRSLCFSDLALPPNISPYVNMVDHWLFKNMEPT